MKKKVLFIVDTNTYFMGLFNIAKFIFQKYDPIFYFSRNYTAIKKDKLLLKKTKIKFLVNSVKEKSLFLPKLTTLFPFPWLFSYKEYRQSFIVAGELLDRYRPLILILAADNIWYTTSIFIKVAHKRKIPVITVPQWIAGSAEPAEFVYQNPDHDGKKFPNNIIANLFPKWVLRYKNKILLRLPAKDIIFREIYKIVPPKPWILHSGDSDKIALESLAMEKFLIKNGFRKEQLEVVGSVQNDILFKHLKNMQRGKKNLFYELKIDKNKPVLLSPLPPDFLYQSGGRPECEFKNYNDLVNYWIDMLTKFSDKYNIIISLHPSITNKEAAFLSKFPVIISRKNIFDLIPFCSLFVASVSATIQWAIASGIPVINYDVYKYRYHDYDSAKGVITIEKKEDFEKVLEKITTDKKYYQKIKEKQEKSAPDWGTIDGESGKRILNLIDELIKNEN